MFISSNSLKDTKGHPFFPQRECSPRVALPLTSFSDCPRCHNRYGGMHSPAESDDDLEWYNAPSLCHSGEDLPSMPIRVSENQGISPEHVFFAVKNTRNNHGELLPLSF